MSMIAMNPTEEKQIDSHIEQMMDWAKTHQAEAEQLALDSARLMACTTDRVDRLKKQGFFKRCWNRFTGATGEMESANTGDIIQIQKKAFRYINMLQEQQLLMAHSLLALKNNLVSLAIREKETRDMIGMLAQRTQDRFELLETRTDQLEISTNLQGWLLGLEERDYDKKFPTEYMRMFRVINDFYQIKKDNWNYNDLIFMRKALRTVGIDPKSEITLNTFIDKLTEEIQQSSVGLENYDHAISAYAPLAIPQYSEYVIENISSPVFASVHGLKIQYTNSSDIVEVLKDKLEINDVEAQKLILQKMISNMNVDMNHKFSLGETAIEIMGSIRLVENLTQNIEPSYKSNNAINVTNVNNVGNLDIAKELTKLNTYISELKQHIFDISKISQLCNNKSDFFCDIEDANKTNKERHYKKRSKLADMLNEAFTKGEELVKGSWESIDNINNTLLSFKLKSLANTNSLRLPPMRLEVDKDTSNTVWEQHYTGLCSRLQKQLQSCVDTCELVTNCFINDASPSGGTIFKFYDQQKRAASEALIGKARGIFG